MSMVREALRRLQEVFLLDTRPVEFMSGWLAFGWGLFLLFPPSVGNSATLQAMSQTAPLWVWGTAVGSLGAVQICSSAFRLNRLRTAASFFIAPFWAFVTVAIFLGGSAAAGFYAYAVFAGMCSWSYIRLVGDGLGVVYRRIRPRGGKP
jgi:hypothetical protein